MKEIQEDDKLELKNRNPYVHSETTSYRVWVYGLAFFMIIRPDEEKTKNTTLATFAVQ